MPDFASLVLGVDSSEVPRANKELDQLTAASRKASRSTDTLTKSTDKTAASQGKLVSHTGRTTRAITTMDGAVGRAASRLVLLGGAFLSASKIGGAADSYSKMTNGLKAMGVEASQTAATIGLIGDIANRTRSPLDATAQMYQRISIAGKDLGASQAEVLRFTENVGLALAQTGASASESSGALLQLSQAMAAGTVRAEEFNSILEGAFPIAQAAADGIDAAGGSVGRLRQLVVEGKVSSEAFFDAIISRTPELEASFEKTSATMGQAFTVMGNNFTTFIGEMDAATGASSAVADAIIFLASNINDIAGFAVAAGGAVALSYVPAMYGAVAATGAWVASLITLKGAMLATGIGALVVGAGLLLGTFIDLVRKTGTWGAALRVLGSVASGVWEGIMASASAIGPALESVWDNVAAGFLKMLRYVARQWADFLHGVAGASQNLSFMPGMDSTILALNDAAIKAGSGVHSLTASIDGYQTSAAAAMEQAKALAEGGFNRASAALAVLNMVVAEHGEGSDEAKSAAEELRKELEKVPAAAGKAGKAMKDLVSETEAFDKALEDAAYTAEDFGREKAGIIISGVDGVANAWGDFVSRGFSDFKGFVDNILGSFQGMLSQMIAMAARNQIMIGLGVGGSVTGTAAGAGGLLGGGGGGLLSGAGSLLGLGGGGGIVGAAQGVWSGLSGVLSGGGLGSSFANLGGLITGTSSGLGALGAALPALGIALAGITLLVKGFSREYKGSGLRGHFGAEGFDGEQFDFYKGGVFRSDRTDISELDAEFERVLDDSIVSMTTGLRDMAAALGLGSDAINKFVGEDFQLWTNDMDQASIQAAFEEQLLVAANGMAELILVTEKFSQFGENAFDTLSRLSGSLLTVNNVLDMLDGKQFQSTLLGGSRASDLVDQFGGSDQFTATATAYWQTYYSQAEQHETLMGRLADQFAGLNVTMPETREGFRDLVEAQRLSTVEGRETYAALLGLSGAFADLVPEVSEVETGLQGVTEATGNVAERMGLLRQLYTLQGKDKELASLQLAQLDEGNRRLQMRVWHLQDEAAIDRETQGIRTQLLQLRGAEDRLRERELAGLDESNRALQERIWRIEDEAAITDERRGLQETLWAALGKTDKLRARELAGLDESNRAIQERIWRIEDEAEASARLGTLLSTLSKDVSDAMTGVSEAINAEISSISDTAADTISQLASDLSEASANADAARSAVIGFINDIEESSVGAFQRMRDAVRQVIASREPISVQQELSQYRRAQAQIYDFASGKEFTESQLDSALSGISEDSSQFFGSYADYAFDTARTTQALVGLEGITEGQLSEAEQQVAALRELYDVSEDGFDSIEAAVSAMQAETAKADQLEREISTLETWRDKQVSILEAQLEAAQDQADASLGISGALLTVAQALAALNVATGSLGSVEGEMTRNQQRENAVDNQTGNVSALWDYEQRILGTDRATLKPWEKTVYDDLKVQGFAQGGTFGGGLRVVGERGPEMEFSGPSHISNNASTADFFKNQAELVSELRALRMDVQALQSYARQGNINTGKTARVLTDWDRYGQAPERTA